MSRQNLSGKTVLETLHTIIMKIIVSFKFITSFFLREFLAASMWTKDFIFTSKISITVLVDAVVWGLYRVFLTTGRVYYY